MRKYFSAASVAAGTSRYQAAHHQDQAGRREEKEGVELSLVAPVALERGRSAEHRERNGSEGDELDEAREAGGFDRSAEERPRRVPPREVRERERKKRHVGEERPERPRERVEEEDQRRE